jgi:hypothetical protein
MQCVTCSHTVRLRQCGLLSDSSIRTLTELCFESTRSPSADCKFLTLYPTNFTAPDEGKAYSRYGATQWIFVLITPVPTYFDAVQRSRLPMIALPLDRGLSDTNVDEVNQDNSTKNTNKSKIFGSYSSHAPKSETWGFCCSS